MQVTIEIPEDRVQRLRERALARGLTLEQWLVELVDVYAPPNSIAHLQRTDPDEWARQFHEWAESHDRTTPPLSDEAISRESIYPDRF